jgi:hypothetical protein
MPLQQTSGNVTADAYGGGVTAIPNYIEDVFSTWLYRGNSTITNGIDLSTKGGLFWVKARSGTAQISDHCWVDTVRGADLSLASNLDTGNYSISGGGNTPPTFTTTGFTTGDFAALGSANTNYASWTFRKQPKFFDIVTWTGTGANRTIAHALGSVPGCIMVKRTDTTGAWQVYHSSLANTQYMVLNTTAAVATGATRWNSTTPTSSVFSVGTDATVNASGGTYVAYVFASNAGGFGLTGTDNVISCGSWTSTGSEVSVTLGYEPQWLLYKRASGGTGSWAVADNMRGVPTGSASNLLNANTTAAEAAGTNITFSATGFSMSVGTAGDVWIYIAIRRGPMKVPTDATTVYTSSATTNTTGATITTNFPVDLAFDRPKAAGYNWQWQDRLRGSLLLQSNATSAEFTPSPLLFTFDSNTSVKTNGYLNGEGAAHAWTFRRAPSFFDEVCYTGTGVARTVTHNLAAVPELMIVKARSVAYGWPVYASSLGNTKSLELQDTFAAYVISSYWNNTSPTSSVFTVGTDVYVNQSTVTYVAYLFATCPGVSKVFSFTGNGTTQTINCGFTGGARFVLLKASSATGGWYVYDTARGMTTLTDPYLLLNSTAAEVATLGSVTTVSTGFAVNEAITTGVNTNGVTYIGLAIA